MTPPVQVRWAIELIGLGKSHRAGGRQSAGVALAPTSLRVAAGQVLGVVGPNGSGKSTLLKLLAGLWRPTEGTFRLSGPQDGSTWMRGAIGYLGEQPRFPGHFSGRAWLRFCGGLSGLRDPELEMQCAELLTWFGLAQVAEQGTREYSHGMRQKLGLAQTWLADPEIVLLDEPLDGLDPEGVRALTERIRGHAKRGKTVVLTAPLTSASLVGLCDRVVVLGRGRVIAEGAPRDLVGATCATPPVLSAWEALYRAKSIEYENNGYSA